MGQAQDFIVKLIGIAMLVAGGLCIVKGAFSVLGKNAAGGDDLNIAGWKSISSWWALGGVILAGGSYMTFAQFFNGIFSFLFG
jgi:hypothetical protein